MSFAIIETGGKQYKVSASNILKVEKLDIKKGNKVEFKKVLLVNDDKTVEIGDPRIEFKAAIVRKDLDGYYQDYWILDESVSREEALYMFTKWAAYSVFEEDIKGTIEVGKLADLTIFSKDLMIIPEEEIMSSEVTMTIVDGRVVYSK